MQHLALDQPGEGLQADVRMRADVQALAEARTAPARRGRESTTPDHLLLAIGEVRRTSMPSPRSALQGWMRTGGFMIGVLVGLLPWASWGIPRGEILARVDRGGAVRVPSPGGFFSTMTRGSTDRCVGRRSLEKWTARDEIDE